jgi:hypothetical protein
LERMNARKKKENSFPFIIQGDRMDARKKQR